MIDGTTTPLESQGKLARFLMVLDQLRFGRLKREATEGLDEVIDEALRENPEGWNPDSPEETESETSDAAPNARH